jgi:hypothetical protein
LAISPAATYPSQVDTTDIVGYPFGAAKNVAAIGDGTGTPLEEKWVSDLFGFEQALLSAAGIIPNGNPDKVGASQYFDAIKFVCDARAKLALQKSQALNWPERSSFANTSAANSSVPIAYDPAPSTQGIGSNDLLMAMTADTLALTSDDGVVWRNSGSFGGVLGSVAYDLAAGLSGASGGVHSFLASQTGGTNLMRSTDGGNSWTLLAGALPSTSNAVLCNGLGSVWVACGTLGALVRSTDGLTWSNAGVSISGWGTGAKRIVWNGSLFAMIAGGVSDKVATSPDGLTWTVRTLPTTQTWNGLAYSQTEALWMAISDGGAVVTSSDGGVTWIIATSVANATAKDLAVIGSVWVAPTRNGDYGGVAYSIDRGLTWSNVAVGNHRVATGGWNRVLAAEKRFVLVHATGTAIEFALSQRSL